MGIHFIQENEYPKLLKEIGKSAPKQLYYKGFWHTGIFENCLAVVGSRQMTGYGKRVVEQIVTPLSGAGITIVSGFMYGVDAASHKAALNAGGRTIAVMPCGIERIHPEYQQELYHDILNNNGLVISEYEGDMQPVYWTYPRRNRIVAGLSKAVLIVEAGEKSGSLITANWAKKFKRKVFVVPGPITSENSKGIMQLIREGAIAISSAKDILDFYKIEYNDKLSQSPQKNFGQKLDAMEKQIIDKLRGESLDIDELSRSFVISTSELGTTLSLMELKGLIEHSGGKYYAN